MKITFVSNYFNHHQKELADAFAMILGDGYTFISTSQMGEDRIKLGYKLEQPSYVHYSYIDDVHYEQSIDIIDSADVVIFGSAPEKMIKNRIKEKKLILRYSERPLKKGLEIHKYPFRFLKWRLKNPPQAPIYLLCASAYTSTDYAKFGLFKNRTYKWGYFPKLILYKDVELLISTKKKNSLLWVGRLIEVKHPELAVSIAKRLKDEGYRFNLNIIGIGDMQERLSELILLNNLNDCVHILGSMSPEEVRKHMEESEIFLFTSDRNEGWGAVLNEAMNSGCAVVASHAIGSVPYLIENKSNGLIYKDGDKDDLYIKVKYLLDFSQKRMKIGHTAYLTILNDWNAVKAAERVLTLSKTILNGEKSPDIFASGICSKANGIKDNLYIDKTK